MSTLRKLLEEMHTGSSFGDAFEFSSPEAETVYFERMERVEQDYVCKIEPFVDEGLADLSVAERTEFISGSTRWLAFSSGLVGDMMSDTERLSDMAVLTWLTTVVNWRIDRGDAAMNQAIERFSDRARHPHKFIVPGRRSSQEVRARSSLLLGCVRGLYITAHPADFPKLMRDIGLELIQDGKRIHDLSMGFREAEESNVFLTEVVGKDSKAGGVKRANEIARLMITTSGIQSVTDPLYSMLRRENKTLESLKKVRGSEYVTRLLKLGNAVIRVQDDAGDRERDSDPSKFSINLFNQPAEPLIRAFCREVELDVKRTEMVVEAFPAADTPEKRHDLITVFTDHFQQNFEDAPEKYGLYTKLVRRALAAGEANEVGDDELARRAQTE